MYFFTFFCLLNDYGPLFENSQNAEETTRNVAAACLGKLATIAPSRLARTLCNDLQVASNAYNLFFH